MHIDPRKVFVLQAYPGQNCLERMTHPKIRMRTPDQGRRGNEITLLPASLNFDFVAGFEDIPDWAWEPARQGDGKVVFDASLEGHPHDTERTRQLHGVLQRAGVSTTQAVYITQDRGYAAAYRRHCAEAGEGPPMKVIVYDYWIRQVLRRHERTGAATFEARRQAYAARPRRRGRRFLSLNNTLRPTKTLFLLRLIRDGLWSQGAISVGGVQALRAAKGLSDREMNRSLFGVRGFQDLKRELRPLLPQLEAMGQVRFLAPEPDRAPSTVGDEPLAEYADTWFSVVTETEMRDWPNRITEKPLKPLLNFHPFVMFGNAGALGLLRDYGFETYPGLFEEAYDEEPDPRRRFERVYREVQRLCAMDEAALDRLDRAAEDAVIRNAHHGLVHLPWRFRDEIDPRLVRDILAP